MAKFQQIVRTQILKLSIFHFITVLQSDSQLSVNIYYLFFNYLLFVKLFLVYCLNSVLYNIKKFINIKILFQVNPLLL